MKLYLSLLIIVAVIYGCNRGITDVIESNQDSAIIATIQLISSETGNFSEVTELVKEAKTNGAELVIFPESSIFGWLNPAVFTQAQPIPGTYSNQLSAIAQTYQIWLAIGLAEQGPPIPSEPGEYEVYDSGILINPSGQIVLHHRKYNVLKNAFNPLKCPIPNSTGCSYLQGSLSDIKTVDTPFGRTGLLVCADAYTYDTTALSTLKKYKPELLIIPWGVGAASSDDCGSVNYNATLYAAEAAKYLKTAYVIGANATGQRRYGRYLPSVYCGFSGFATPSGGIGGEADGTEQIAYFTIPLGSIQ